MEGFTTGAVTRAWRWFFVAMIAGMYAYPRMTGCMRIKEAPP